MSARAAARLGRSVWVLCVALAGFTLTFGVLSVGIEPRVPGPSETPSAAEAVAAGVYFVAIVAFATVGAFVVWRRPGNDIGWVFLAIGAVVPVPGRRGPVRGVLVAASAGLPSKRGGRPVAR